MTENFNIPGAKIVCPDNDPGSATKYLELPDGLRLIFQDGKYTGYYDPNLPKGVF